MANASRHINANTTELLIYRTMAAATAIDSSDSLTADLFDCAVCMEDMSDRKPRNLTCGHSFCGGCLENIAKRTRRILCPTCHAETFLPEDGVSGLQMNLFIPKVKANVSGIIMRSSILCGMCLSQDRQTIASHVCSDCKVNMYEPCRDYHLKIEIFNDHQFTLLLHSGGNQCSDHRHAMKYICLECKKGLCVHCTIHKSHQGHTDQIKQIESGIVEVKEAMKKQAKKLKETINNIKTSSLEVLRSSVATGEFDHMVDSLSKEKDTYQFLEKWQKTHKMMLELDNVSSKLSVYLPLYLGKIKKPKYIIPDIKVKPIYISTFDEQLGSPGEVAFLEDNSVICLDTQSKTVSRISADHGLLANYCLPNNEQVTCLATQGKYFYLGGNKHVMSNTESSEYIRLPEVQEGLDQLQVLKDGSFMKDKHIVQIYDPETKTVQILSLMIEKQTYTFLSVSSDEKTMFITKPVESYRYQK